MTSLFDHLEPRPAARPAPPAPRRACAAPPPAPRMEGGGHRVRADPAPRPANAGEPDASQRLRRLLKAADRSFGFECLAMAELLRCSRDAAAEFIVAGIDAKAHRQTLSELRQIAGEEAA